MNETFTISPNSSEAYFYLPDNLTAHDVALVQIQCKDSKYPPAVISKKHLEVFQYLEGISFREHGISGVYGRILEEKEQYFETDSQGTHGFSGTGLYHKGKLVAIHQGQGTFVHRSNQLLTEFQAYQMDLENFTTCVNHVNNRTCNSTVFDGLFGTIVRNPRTVVVQARLAYELLLKDSTLRDQKIGFCDKSLSKIKLFLKLLSPNN